MSEDKAPYENPYLKLKFRYVTARDVIKRLSKYYPYARRHERKQAPRLLASYVYIAYNMLGEVFEDGEFERTFSQRDIVSHLDLSGTAHFYKYIGYHERYMNKSPKYKEVFIMCLKDLSKIETNKQKKIHEEVSI